MDWAVCVYISGCIVLFVAYVESYCPGVHTADMLASQWDEKGM
jgi:hypothetical protein